jgi:TrmH family RNA methyltransferase
MALSVPITSRSNARVKLLRASFRGKAARPGELLGIEGEHVVAEALRSGLVLQTVFVREGSEVVVERLALAGTEIVVLSRDVFGSALETASPQGIAAVVAIPEEPQGHKFSGTLLVLEAVQDPGNLGTLLRTAEAFGAALVLMTPECVNRWNPKVVRASAGSVFRMPVLQLGLVEINERLREAGVTSYAAVAHGDGAQSLLEVKFAGAAAILIGNEGAGLSTAAVAMAEVQVRIPCAVESLNAAVAGSTILYEAMRQRMAAEEMR